MGFFTKKPDKELQETFVKQATYAVTWFGYALKFKRTNPSKLLNNQSVDLSLVENRNAIRTGVVNLITTQSLDGNPAGPSTEILISLIKKPPNSVMEDAVICTMFAIHAMNSLARFFYVEFPKFDPLREMIDHLAKVGCCGAAQTLGSTLPDEVVTGWPHFGRLFNEAKAANYLLWPDT